VAGQTIPNDQQPARDVPLQVLQVLQELDDLRAANGSRKQPEVEVPPGDPGDRRQGFPVEVILQHRRLSLWRPGTAAVRTLAQSAFVDEGDRQAVVFGLFFNSGQRCCF